MCEPEARDLDRKKSRITSPVKGAYVGCRLEYIMRSSPSCIMVIVRMTFVSRNPALASFISLLLGCRSYLLRDLRRAFRLRAFGVQLDHTGQDCLFSTQRVVSGSSSARGPPDSNRVGFAGLSLPQHIAAQAFGHFGRQHVPAGCARRGWGRRRGKVVWIANLDRCGRRWALLGLHSRELKAGGYSAGRRSWGRVLWGMR